MNERGKRSHRNQIFEGTGSSENNDDPIKKRRATSSTDTEREDCYEADDNEFLIRLCQYIHSMIPISHVKISKS